MKDVTIITTLDTLIFLAAFICTGDFVMLLGVFVWGCISLHWIKCEITYNELVAEQNAQLGTTE